MKTMKKYTIGTQLPALEGLKGKTFTDYNEMLNTVETFVNDKIKGIVDHNVQNAKLYLLQDVIIKAKNVKNSQEFKDAQALINDIVTMDNYPQEAQYAQLLQSEQFTQFAKIKNSDEVKQAEMILSKAAKEQEYLSTLEVIIAESLVTDIAVINSDEYKNANQVMLLEQGYNDAAVQEALVNIGPDVKAKIEKLKTFKKMIKALSSKEYKEAKKLLNDKKYTSYLKEMAEYVKDGEPAEIIVVEESLIKFIEAGKLLNGKKYKDATKSVSKSKSVYEEFVTLSTSDFESMKEEDVLEAKTRIEEIKKVASSYKKALDFIESDEIKEATETLASDLLIANYEASISDEYIAQKSLEDFRNNNDMEAYSAASAIMVSDEVLKATQIKESDEYTELSKDDQVKNYSKNVKLYEDSFKELVEEFATISKTQLESARAFISDPAIQEIVRNASTDVYKNAIELINSKQYQKARSVVNTDEYKSADMLLKSDGYQNTLKYFKEIDIEGIETYLQSKECKDIRSKLSSKEYNAAIAIVNNTKIKELLSLLQTTDYKSAVLASLRDSFDKANSLINAGVITISEEVKDITVQYQGENGVLASTVTSKDENIFGALQDLLIKDNKEIKNLNIISIIPTQKDTFIVYYKI